MTLPWLYFTLCYSTFIYHGSTSLYLILHDSTTAQIHSTSLYMTLPWLYFSLLPSMLFYHGSTSHYLTLITILWIYFTLRHSTHNFTMSPLQSTSLYIILTWLYLTILDSTLHYHGSTSLNHGSTSLYFTLRFFTMALLHST